METVITENGTNLRDAERQSAELYSYSDTEILTTLSLGERTVAVAVVGEMRIVYDGGVIRRADELRDLSISTDEELVNFLEREDVEMVNNPWFEVYDLESPEYGEVCHDALWSLDYAVSLLKGNKND